MLLKLEKTLFFAILFLLPTQLAIHFWPSWAFIFGIRIDYFAPTIYLTDTLVITLLSFGFKSIFKYKKYLILLILFSLLNIYFSISPTVTLFKWLKVLEFVSFALYVSDRFKTIGKEFIFKTLFVSLVLFSTIGIAQVLLGHTVGGLLYWLGERSFNTSTPGITLVNIFGQNYLRAYSTFPHPNALAGYLGASTLLLLVNDFFRSDTKKLLGLFIITACFTLTFSLTAFVGIILVFIFRKNTKLLFPLIILASLLMPIISSNTPHNFSVNKNISERLELAVTSGKVISQNFWTGTGLGTNLSFSRLLQPVHNIFLLTLSEVGMFGLLVLIFYFKKALRFLPMVFGFVIITGFFDHYWLDSQQNLLLLSLISGTLTSWKK